MKALSLTGPEANRDGLLALVEEVPGAKVGIKVAALLLILEGQRPGQVKRLLGLNHMALERCIHAVNEAGPQALAAKRRSGRPPRLTPYMQQRLEEDLEKSPQALGLPRPAWDGPTLVVHLKERFGVKVEVRQAERWMHKLGYGLKRGSYTYIQAHAEDARKFGEELKKTADAQDQ